MKADFQEVYESQKDRIYRLCRGFMTHQEDANDLFQDVMVLIWRKLPDFKGDSQISTWIYRLTTNAALLALNRQKRQREVLEEATPTSPIPLSMAQESLAQQEESKEENLQRLRNIIGKLKEIDRVLITLVLEGCQYTEIAEITGLSLSNVGVRINRLKKEIKKQFATYGK